MESLLAVAMLSIGLGVLMVSVSRCLSALKMARDFQTAQWVLGIGELDHPVISTNRMATIPVSGAEYPGGFVFSRNVEEDEDGDSLYLVRTSVVWLSRGREMKEETISYIFEPQEEQ